jgi:ribosome assembly protein YihI (activator of Der GTPase)
MGVPEKFRPGLHLGWYGRGENFTAKRRAELRKVAQSTLEARAKTAKLELDQVEETILTQLTSSGLRTPEATKFLESTLPTIDKLMPKLQLLELQKKMPLLEGGGYEIREDFGLHDDYEPTK